MDLLEIERINLLIDLSKKIKNVMIEQNEIDFIDSIIKKNTDIINKYHKENLLITNETKVELGIYKSAIKKVVLGCYFNKLENKNDRLRSEFKLRCEHIILDEDFKSKYILYSRNVNKYFPNELEKALRDSLHTYIISEFYKQNKEFINNLK